MKPGLEIRVVDPDDDYLGIEIAAATDRFCGSARIFAGLSQLSDVASLLRGFPTSAGDRRTVEFGTREPGYAGGFVKLVFFCQDGAAHAAVSVEIDDDEHYHEKASAIFAFAIEAAELDRFLALLPTLESTQSGYARLSAAA